MNEEAFNLSLRRFLKNFGVTAQREIEQAVRDALESGRLSGVEALKATATIRMPEVGLARDVEGEIRLEEE